MHTIVLCPLFSILLPEYVKLTELLFKLNILTMDRHQYEHWKLNTHWRIVPINEQTKKELMYLNMSLSVAYTFYINIHILSSAIHNFPSSQSVWFNGFNVFIENPTDFDSIDELIRYIDFHKKKNVPPFA